MLLTEARLSCDAAIRRITVPDTVITKSGSDVEAGVMQDYFTHLEKLRKDAAECRLISDLATDTAKRELFDRLASHLIVLADQVEQEMLKRRP